MLSKYNQRSLNIIYSGVDTYVLGKPLILTEGSLTPRTNLLSFNDKSARKYGLTIGKYAMKE